MTAASEGHHHKRHNNKSTRRTSSSACLRRLQTWMCIGIGCILVQQCLFFVSVVLVWVPSSSSSNWMEGEVDHLQQPHRNDASSPSPYVPRKPILAQLVHKNIISSTTTNKNPPTTRRRLVVFDEGPSNHTLSLTNRWRRIQSVRSDTLVQDLDQIDAGSCLEILDDHHSSWWTWITTKFLHAIPGGGSRLVQCLPSIYIIGFEKCGTTALNLALSEYGGNTMDIQYLETRLLDRYDVQQHSLQEWWSRTRPLLPLRWTNHNIHNDNMWLVDKSPTYATTQWTAPNAALLVPSGRFVVNIRNPTDRAYSMFAMYCHHHSALSSSKSFWVEHVETGQVKYVKEVGNHQIRRRGGSLVGTKWRYVSYPPTPQQFHAYITGLLQDYQLHSTKNATTAADRDHPWMFPISRPHRLLMGGLYAPHIRHWLQYFDNGRQDHKFILVPMEIFFANKSQNVPALMRTLGIHHTSATSTWKHRMANTIHEYWHRQQQGGDNQSPPMLEETRSMLNAFYCASTTELVQEFLGGRTELVPGYTLC